MQIFFSPDSVNIKVCGAIFWIYNVGFRIRFTGNKVANYCRKKKSFKNSFVQ